MLEDQSFFDVPQERHLSEQPPPPPASVGIDESTESINVRATSVIDKLITHAARKDLSKPGQESFADGEQAQRILNEAKKITYGILRRQGCHARDHAAIKEREEKKQKEQQKEDQRTKEKIAVLTEY